MSRALLILLALGSLGCGMRCHTHTVPFYWYDAQGRVIAQTEWTITTCTKGAR